MPCPAPLELLRRPGTEIPGYSGYIPLKEQVCGKGFTAANDDAAETGKASAKGSAARSRSASRENLRTLEDSGVFAGSYQPTYDKARFFRVGGRSGRNPTGPDTSAAAWSASLRSAGDGENVEPLVSSAWRYLRSPSLEPSYPAKDSAEVPRSLSPERKIPGYAGHIPRVRSDNVFGKTFLEASKAGWDSEGVKNPMPASRSASPLRTPPKTPPEEKGAATNGPPRPPSPLRTPPKYPPEDKGASMNGPPGAIPLKSKKNYKDYFNDVLSTRSPSPVRSRSVTPRKSPARIPGYSGYVPQKGPQNIYGVSSSRANEMAASGVDFDTPKPRIGSIRSPSARSPCPSERSSASARDIPETLMSPSSGPRQRREDAPPLGRESTGEIPSYIDHVPRKNRETYAANTRETLASNREDGPPFGRESTGEIPSFIDHVPRKNRDLGTTSARETPRSPSTSRRKARSLSPRPLRRDVPNYSGHIPGLGPENVYGVTYGMASQLSARSLPENEKANSVRSGSSQRSDVQPVGRVGIPGYAGYIPKKGPCNILGTSFAKANELAAEGVNPVATAQTEAVLLQESALL